MLKQIHSNEDFTIVTALLGKTGRLSFGVNGALKKFKVKKGTATWDFAINKKWHFDRINYECRQWKMTLNRHCELSDPTDYGWVNDDNRSLGIHWTECKPAPEALLEFLTCSCCKSEC